jgi:hypothetical protein
MVVVLLTAKLIFGIAQTMERFRENCIMIEGLRVGDF